MQFSTLTSLVATLCLAGVGTADFLAFPARLTCNISDTATRTVSRAELQNIVANNPRSLLESSAQNIATGAACSSLTDPVYSVDGPGFFLVFAYKQSTGDYTLCSGTGFDVEKTGYGSPCWTS